ncbi:MAG: hypothetical protein ABI867_08470 [Kofleriaceae bacterium]
MSLHAQVWRILAGTDTTARAGLPASELLAPLPLFALGLLALNDWVLKGSSAPAWLTGKLSDFAGVFAFPLVVTAVADLVGAAGARLGIPWDFTLRRWKLQLAIGATAIVFAAMKLSPLVGSWVERLWSQITGGSEIYPDPTDAIAIVVLAATWWHGRRAIARGAYGRLAWAKRHRAAAAFADAARCGADPAAVAALDAAVATWLAGGAAAPVDAALAKLR